MYLLPCTEYCWIIEDFQCENTPRSFTTHEDPAPHIFREWMRTSSRANVNNTSNRFKVVIHSKISRVSMTRKGNHLGPNSIPRQRWPGNQSTWCKIWPRAGSIWPHYLSVWLNSESSLTRNGVWPQWTLFRVTANPGVFRVYVFSVLINMSRKVTSQYWGNNSSLMRFELMLTFLLWLFLSQQ